MRKKKFIIAVFFVAILILSPTISVLSTSLENSTKDKMDSQLTKQNNISFEDEKNNKSILCRKQVWNSSSQTWVDDIKTTGDQRFRFNITLLYNGTTTLTEISIKDILPVNLEYAGNATLPETNIIGKIIYWNLSTVLMPGENISIEFDVNMTIVSASVSKPIINTANVTALECGIGQVTCQDTTQIIIIVPEKICEKQVWDSETQQWSKETNAETGDTIRFRITITYHGNYTLYNIHIKDTLPNGLEYANNANPPETTVNGNTIYWNLSTTLQDGEITIIEFDALVIEDGVQINYATVTANECNGEIHYCSDYASVIVDEIPDICEKEVWDSASGKWVKETTARVGDTLRFRITVSYVGNYTLYNIHVHDLLPPGLQYANNANPPETAISGQSVYWNLSTGLQNGESTYIEFDVLVTADGVQVNFIQVRANECSGEIWNCCDTATVFVDESCKICEKQVWDSETQQWSKETNAETGDTIRFRITITYHGNYTLYNIHIKDTLPNGLEYANNANPPETTVNGNTIYWNLSARLDDGESITIEFDTLVISEGVLINFLDLLANECCGAIRHCSDSASVIAEQAHDLIADAGGPYQGYIGVPIQFTGTVAGGASPYSYTWHFDDGQTSNNRNPSHIYSNAGSYLVTFMVTDYLGFTAVDTVNVTIDEDETPPTISIEKPTNYALYIQNKAVSWFFSAVIIGPINVTISAYDSETQIEKVDLYIDGIVKKTFSAAPFEWMWSELSIGKHFVSAVATDKAGNTNQKMITVWKIF